MLPPIVGKDGTVDTIYAIYLPTSQTAYLTLAQFNDLFLNGGPSLGIEGDKKYVKFQMVNGVVQPIYSNPSKPLSLAQVKAKSEPYNQSL